MTNRTEYIRETRAKFDSYDSSVWRKDGIVHIGSRAVYVAGFDDQTGGYVVIHKGHKFDIKTGVNELKSAILLSNNGYAVELKDEPGRVPQYDAIVNNIPTEIKVMSGFRNIHKRAEDASYQGAIRIVYYIDFDNNKEMFKRFSNVYKTIEKISEIWYIKNGKLFFFHKK